MAPADEKGLSVKQLANWRVARVASLVPNVLPQEEAAACVTPDGSCFCQLACSWCASCKGYFYCLSCKGRPIYHGICSAC